MTEQPFKDLELEDDIRFHKIEWALQRAGRILLFSFVAAAAAGLFGDGIISKKTVKDGVLEIEYDRFARAQKKALFEIRLDSTQRVVGRAQRKVWINNSFLKNVKIEHIEPEPGSVQADSEGHTYIFESSGTGEAVSIFIYFTPERPGKQNAVVRADEDAGQVVLRQFIFP